jgi:hypothetical protein
MFALNGYVFLVHTQEKAFGIHYFPFAKLARLLLMVLVCSPSSFV